MLSNTLYVYWSGTAEQVRRVVQVLREEGLDARWDRYEIEIRPGRVRHAGTREGKTI